MAETETADTTETGEVKAADVTFTAEQHSRINEIAARERRAGEVKGKQEAEKAIFGAFGVGSVDELRAKLETVAEESGKPDERQAKRDAEWKSKLDAALSARDEALKAVEAVRSDYRQKELRASLVSAAAKAKAINPEMVADLTVRSMAFGEDGGVYVQGDAGFRLNAKGNPMGPDEYVGQYLSENPFLLQPSGTQGGGSTTTGKARTYTREQIRAMSPEEINANFEAIAASGAL